MDEVDNKKKVDKRKIVNNKRKELYARSVMRE
jgi:hypothetical protein